MIYIVNGKPESGKTTFENFVKTHMGDPYCVILSTITVVKEIAKYCGWNGEKTPKDRKFLSDLKDLLTEWHDIPFNSVVNTVRVEKNEFDMYGIKDYAIFIDCREPKEIDRLKKKLGAKTVLIRRDNHQIETSNHADEEVEDYEYDIVIKNNGTLDYLERQAKAFIWCEELHRDKKGEGF